MCKSVKGVVTLFSRVAHKDLQARIVEAEEVQSVMKNGMTVALGGYTSAGYPKVFVNELIKRKKVDETFKINLITGANVGPVDAILAEENIVHYRAPMIGDRSMSRLVNKGTVSFAEQQMHRMPHLLRSGAFGKIDVAIIEAIRITEEGFVIPTSSVGMIQYFVNLAETVIIEINTAQPKELEGIHDVYNVGVYPNRKPIPISRVNERIGKGYIEVDPNKVAYIVHSEILDNIPTIPEGDTITNQIADHLLNFLEIEMAHSGNSFLPPIQTGFGKLANDIVRSLNRSNFTDLEFFCGILQESNMELIANGKVKAASTGSIHLTDEVIKILKDQPEMIKDITVIRNNDISNSSEIIERFGLISLVSGIEIDIYGNVNVSHISGTNIVNGIGGGANFAHNAALTIALLPSIAKGGEISTIVPMVTHHDIGEHDIDIVITEHGIADLRGKSDIDRAKEIIENCTDIYHDQLASYLDCAVKKVGGHHPQLLSEAFDWHRRLKEKGSMLQ